MKTAALAFLAAFAVTYGWRMAAPPPMAHMPAPAPLPAPASSPAPPVRTTAQELTSAVRRGLAAPAGSAERAELIAMASLMQDFDLLSLCQMLHAAAPGFERDTALVAALKKLAATDPFRAWELFSTARLSIQDHSRHQFIKQMVASDPRRAWDVLTEGGSLLQDDTVREIARAWGNKRGLEAAGFGNRMRSPEARKAFLSGLFLSWVKSDFDGFQRWFRAQPDQDQLATWINPYVFSGWSSDEPMPTMGWAHLDFFVSLNLPKTGNQHPLGPFLQSAWWFDDLRKNAPAWIERQTDPALREAAWASLVPNLPLDQIETALSQIQDPDRLRLALKNALMTKGWSDPAKSLAVALRVEDPALRNETIITALSTWAQLDPTAALAEFRRLAPQLPPQTLADAASAWNRTEGSAEVLLMLAAQPDQVIAAKGARALGERWMSDRPADLTRWLAASPPGPVRDAVASAAVSRLEFTDPAHGVTLAMSIRDADARSKGVTFAYQRWLAQNAPAAKAWLADIKPAQLSATERASMDKMAKSSDHRDPRHYNGPSRIVINGRELHTTY